MVRFNNNLFCTDSLIQQTSINLRGRVKNQPVYTSTLWSRPWAFQVQHTKSARLQQAATFHIHVYIYIYTCMGYIFAFVHRSTNWKRMQHHGVFCTLSTVGPYKKKACWVSNPLNVSCHQGVWLEVGYTMIYDVIMSRVEIVQSYLQQDTLPDGRCLLRHEFEWILIISQNFNPKRLCCWIMALHALKHVCRRSMSDITVCVAAQCAGIWWGWSMIISLEMARGRKIRETMGIETNMSY